MPKKIKKALIESLKLENKSLKKEKSMMRKQMQLQLQNQEEWHPINQNL